MQAIIIRCLLCKKRIWWEPIETVKSPSRTFVFAYIVMTVFEILQCTFISLLGEGLKQTDKRNVTAHFSFLGHTHLAKDWLSVLAFDLEGFLY